MKIIENTKEPKPITFADIKVGDVFKLKNDTKYYMKAEYLSFYNYEYSWGNYYTDDDQYQYDYRNVVCLSNGKLVKISKTTEVIPIDCELIIK